MKDIGLTNLIYIGVTSSVTKRPSIPAPIPAARGRSTGQIFSLVMQQDSMLFSLVVLTWTAPKR